jgi:hypothetical protein
MPPGYYIRSRLAGIEVSSGPLEYNSAMHPEKMATTTLAEAAEGYLQWVRANRAERFWKRQEHLLRSAILPQLGHHSLNEVLAILIPHTLTLTPENQADGLDVMKTVNAVIRWFLEQ